MGSAACRRLSQEASLVIGVDNDLRARFFGPEASTWAVSHSLGEELPNFQLRPVDIRDEASVSELFRLYGDRIDVIVHAAAQPSHDWAARDPFTDFEVNARGTLVMLECTRRYAPGAVFVHLSTNKVYGDHPNTLPLVEHATRWELDPSHRWARLGFDESMSLDDTTHSLFGVSKTTGDLYAQEYGRYFGLQTTALRCGCLTGPGSAGAELHGFLAYLAKCTYLGRPYRVLGYKGKQVRDNLHCDDLVEAIMRIIADPGRGEAYNMGGGRRSNCSMLEAISLTEEIAERRLRWEYEEENRLGDHIWWISDTSRFEARYQGWKPVNDVPAILESIIRDGAQRWTP